MHLELSGGRFHGCSHILRVLVSAIDVGGDHGVVIQIAFSLFTGFTSLGKSILKWLNQITPRK
ncbi:uncharacterized protein PHALS_04259 [Plasmopara halstedii]|uniref:Uncharacterized protein n=1 Tax=Plasmopara halstedii TaxID=4781 RepID=A0A0N7L7L1_PLAHL|nr:uncharacterized protein PHALS_04259 [Plasmopara halstedii]CEG47379.1 hypothetical protein PHALS_04259 [Plasmopara halstedii]|eukprot:XP_024583748.1 hypothetical protein PHALS_04259 [Plasmopara halstedii]